MENIKIIMNDDRIADAMLRDFGTGDGKKVDLPDTYDEIRDWLLNITKGSPMNSVHAEVTNKDGSRMDAIFRDGKVDVY